MKYLKLLWEDFQAKIDAIWSDISPAIAAFAHSIARAGGKVALSVASEAISEIEADPSMVLNSNKRSALLNAIFQKLADRGVQVGEELIHEIRADPSLITNSDKRDTAIDMIIQKMADNGVQVSETEALNAVQAEYTKLKAESTPE